MFETDYRLYLAGTISLVRSMIIKSEVTADNINNYLKLMSVPVDESSPATWKYYLNLTGQYHAIDTPIQILSSDTQTVIELNKVNLALHPITKIEYGLGGKYYKELRKQYPKMRLFLTGVFADNNITDAINAKDHEILYVDSTYIDSNEVSLMSNLQESIYRNAARWDIVGYQNADRLYSPAFYNNLLHFIIGEIPNLRLAACNTREVCSYHLWSKLKGTYSLDKYRDILTIDQALWLYRNIEYVIVYAGKRDVLEAMIENLLKPVSLKVSKYDYINHAGNLVNTHIGDSRFVTRDYYDEAIDISEDIDIITEDVALYECQDVAPSNRDEFDKDLKVLNELPLNTALTTFPVGLLKVEQDSNAISDLLNDVQFKLDYWVYLSSLDMFNGVYRFDFPGQGVFNLTAKEALILFIYANSRANGVKLDLVPSPTVYDVIRPTYGGPGDFRPFAPDTLVSDSDIDEALLGNLVPEVVDDLSELELFVTKVISRKIRHDIQWQKKETDYARGYMKNIVNGIYQSITVDLVPANTQYVDWLGSLKIADFGISFYEWQDISTIILKTLLDVEPGVSKLPKNQRSMIEIVNSLTSYSVIITAGESQSGYKNIDWAFKNTETESIDLVVDQWLQTAELKIDDDHVDIEVTDSVDLEMATFELINEDQTIIEVDLSTGLSLEMMLSVELTDQCQTGGFDVEEISVT